MTGTHTANPVTMAMRRAAYGAAQTARVGWYTLQYVGARHLSGPLTPPGEVPRPYQSGPIAPNAFRESFLSLMRREAADIAAGVYRLPRDMRRPPNPFRLLDQARRYYAEAMTISRRAHAKGGATEVRTAPEASDGDYPTYYLQNFHFQSGGWLSADSADIYDTQVEALFTGVADAMRRRALPIILPELARVAAEGRMPRFADVGCGTGRLLRDVMDNADRIEAVATDLSPAYLEKARATVDDPRASFLVAPGERMPFEDGSIDVLTSVYLFHELPPRVRRDVAAEFARVLAPGGLYVHVDSVQYGDTGMDVMLEGFPRAVHEPYYDGYCQEDLAALFGGVGFGREAEDLAFLTKVSAFRRPVS